MSTNAFVARKYSVENNDTDAAKKKYSVSVRRFGGPIEERTKERVSTCVEERVMEWEDAFPIYGWFIEKVQNGKDERGVYRLLKGSVEELLQTCEQVLNASQLVWEDSFKAGTWGAIRERQEAIAAGRSRVIKNPTTAMKLLPFKLRVRTWLDRLPQYDERYIELVQRTRDWAEHMLMDWLGEDDNFELYYHSDN